MEVLDSAANAELTDDIPRKVWTREDAHRLADIVFPNALKLELIDGEIIDRQAKKHPHVLWQHLIFGWLQPLFGERALMEAPINVAAEDNERSEPEPDLAVTRKSIRDYDSNPPPEDILLILEVSDSTLQFDLSVKASLYARAKIADYWVIDIQNRLVYVHRYPAQGSYSNLVRYGFHETIVPLADAAAIFCPAEL